MSRFRWLALLLQLTYAAHIAEEYWGGFPAWASARTGVNLTVPVFLSLNGFFFGVMAVGVIAALLAESAQWVLIPLGTVVLINGTAHLIASVVTWSYSPGVITGVLCWIPLGLTIIRTAQARWPKRAVRVGIVAGALLHVLVPLSAWLAARGR